MPTEGCARLSLVPMLLCGAQAAAAGQLAEARVLGPAGGLSLPGEKLLRRAHIATVAQRTSPERS